MDINIEELIKLLPEGYQQACYETKAIERKRTVQTLEKLLVMCCTIFIVILYWKQASLQK